MKNPYQEAEEPSVLLLWEEKSFPCKKGFERCNDGQSFFVSTYSFPPHGDFLRMNISSLPFLYGVRFHGIIKEK